MNNSKKSEKKYLNLENGKLFINEFDKEHVNYIDEEIKKYLLKWNFKIVEKKYNNFYKFNNEFFLFYKITNSGVTQSINKRIEAIPKLMKDLKEKYNKINTIGYYYDFNKKDKSFLLFSPEELDKLPKNITSKWIPIQDIIYSVRNNENFWTWRFLKKEKKRVKRYFFKNIVDILAEKYKIFDELDTNKIEYKDICDEVKKFQNNIKNNYQNLIMNNKLETNKSKYKDICDEGEKKYIEKNITNDYQNLIGNDGWLCEKLIYSKLKDDKLFMFEHLKIDGYSKIKWHNEEKESKKNHDIFIECENKKIYIDVKSTTSKIALFYISINEFNLWKQTIDNENEEYYIFNVYNVIFKDEENFENNPEIKSYNKQKLQELDINVCTYFWKDKD